MTCDELTGIPGLYNYGPTGSP